MAQDDGEEAAEGVAGRPKLARRGERLVVATREQVEVPKEVPRMGEEALDHSLSIKVNQLKMTV